MEALVIQRTHRVPAVSGPAGDGSVVARQFDAALMSVGYKASRELLEHLSGLDAGTVIDVAVRALAAVREQVGDHVRHNTYFRGFPLGVPDTLDFWVKCVRNTLVGPGLTAGYASLSTGALNLLASPQYGRYQHTYEEMLAAHDELIPCGKERVTVLHLGGALGDEIHALYLQLAGSPVPLNDADRDAFARVVSYCHDCGVWPQLDDIPVRENRAIFNRVQAERGLSMWLVDSVTDVLRVACALSDGDVTLAEPTRFRSFKRSVRQVLLGTLDDLISGAPWKLADVSRYREQWKRLGERLHPADFPMFEFAAELFAVARGDKKVTSLAGKVEGALGAGSVGEAVTLLGTAPGMLFRSLDRLLRSAEPGDVDLLLKTVERTADRVSGRVLLSVREHLQNRGTPGVGRVFVNGRGRAWVTPDERAPLDEGVLRELFAVLDTEVARRMPAVDHLRVDPAVLFVALPLSEKTNPKGFGIMPRGSVTPIDGEMLRFFMYWRESKARTDFDLSVLLTDEEFQSTGHVSYTNLRGRGAVHSGDIVEAPDGASEFVDLDLRWVDAACIVPQVNVFAGEGFDEVAESFFGHMTLDSGQQGKPFEPATVRAKSELRGTHRVALPIVFARDGEGRWWAKWLHLYLNGSPYFNRVETNRLSTSLLVRGIVERDYLRVSYLADMLRAKAGVVSLHGEGPAPEGPVTFLGLERPDGLPEGSETYTLDTLGSLVPA